MCALPFTGRGAQRLLVRVADQVATLSSTQHLRIDDNGACVQDRRFPVQGIAEATHEMCMQPSALHGVLCLRGGERPRRPVALVEHGARSHAHTEDRLHDGGQLACHLLHNCGAC